MMLGYMKLKFFIGMSCFVFIHSNPSAVTYSFNTGRFGDRLMSYVHAKWISYKYDFQLLYKPFMFSDQLVLSERERVFKQRYVKFFKHVVPVSKGERIAFDKKNSLYVIPFFSEYLKYKKGQYGGHLVTVNWKDECFIGILRDCIRPKRHLQVITAPKDCIRVAIHVRTGGGFDKMAGEGERLGRVRYSDVCLPLNHPRDEFYIKQIKKVSELFSDKPIYLYIFTDDLDPKRILSKYKKLVDKPNITFNCRKKGNRPNRNVLEDFFSMQQFDCIIRPNSNFSVIASKMGYNWLTIFPVDYKWDENKLIMTQIEMEIKSTVLNNFVNSHFYDSKEKGLFLDRIEQFEVQCFIKRV